MSTNEPLSVSAQLTGLDGQQVTENVELGPRETSVDRVHVGHAQFGGISVNHSGQPGALLARGMIADRSLDYSSVVELSDPAKAMTSQLHGAGLRLGQIAGEQLLPLIIVRNNATAESVINIQIPVTVGGEVQTVELSEITLLPGEVKLLDEDTLQDLQQITEIDAAGIELLYSTEPGSVVASAQSVSETGNHVFRVPLVDPARLPSSAGGYPWDVDTGSTTVFYVKNITDEPQTHSWQVDFEGGVFTSGLEIVDPRETLAIDIRELRDNQVPDLHRTTMPSNASSGQILWSVHGTGDTVLIARTEEVDFLKGLSSTYSCLNCCPNSYYSSYLAPGSVSGPINATTQFTPFQRNQNYYGSILSPFTPWNVSWYSNNASIVTINSSGLRLPQTQLKVKGGSG